MRAARGGDEDFDRTSPPPLAPTALAHHPSSPIIPYMAGRSSWWCRGWNRVLAAPPRSPTRTRTRPPFELPGVAAAELCRSRAVPQQSCAAAELCRSRAVPQQSCAAAELCHRSAPRVGLALGRLAVRLDGGGDAVLLHYDTLNNPTPTVHGEAMQMWSHDDGTRPPTPLDWTWLESTGLGWTWLDLAGLDLTGLDLACIVLRRLQLGAALSSGLPARAQHWRAHRAVGGAAVDHKAYPLLLRAPAGRRHFPLLVRRARQHVACLHVRACLGLA
jgi:hypothetical protein